MTTEVNRATILRFFTHGKLIHLKLGYLFSLLVSYNCFAWLWISEKYLSSFFHLLEILILKFSLIFKLFHFSAF